MLAKSLKAPLHRGLQTFRYLSVCSDCYRPERKWPGDQRLADDGGRFPHSPIGCGGNAVGGSACGPAPRRSRRKRTLLQRGQLPDLGSNLKQSTDFLDVATEFFL
jgi:hypothetical protein